MSKFIILLFLCGFTFLNASLLNEIRVTCLTEDPIADPNPDYTCFNFKSAIPNLRFFDNYDNEISAIKYDKSTQTYLYLTNKTYVKLYLRAPGYKEYEFYWKHHHPDERYFENKEKWYNQTYPAIKKILAELDSIHLAKAHKIFYTVEAVPLSCAAKPGTVLINPTPNDANIRIIPPAELDLTSGIVSGNPKITYSLTIDKINYHQVDTTFTIDEKSFKILDIQLQPLKKTIVYFNYLPYGSTVFLDSDEVGKTPLELKLNPKMTYAYKISRDFRETKEGFFDTDTLAVITLEGELDRAEMPSEMKVMGYEYSNIRGFHGFFLQNYLIGNLSEWDFYTHYIQIDQQPSISPPSLIKGWAAKTFIPGNNNIFFGWGGSFLNGFISKDFYICNFLSLDNILMLESTNTRFNSILTSSFGLNFLNENIVRNYHNRNVIYGSFVTYPDGTEYFKHKERINTWIPVTIDLTSEFKISKSCYLSFRAGEMLLGNNRNNYNSTNKWYYRDEIKNWEASLSVPQPQAIDKKFGLPQKYLFMPYIGLGIHYRFGN